MDEKRLKKAFAAYRKSNDLKLLASTLKEIILYMAKDAITGYEVKFLFIELPMIVEFLDSIDLKTT